MNEDNLMQAARRLGARAAERLDVEATAQAVLARLKEPVRAEPSVWRGPIWLSLAATVTLLIGGGVMLRDIHHGPPPAADVVAPAGMDLNELSAEQLREVLSTFDQSLEQETSPLDTGWEDLSAPELRALLRSLEG